MILDLGCGKKKRPGTVGVDFSDRHDADVIHNLNEFPYPFSTSSVDHIYLDNVLEHLDHPLLVMEELYRILKPNCTIKVIVPYFRSKWAFVDPTHRTFYTVNSFDYYDPDTLICRRYDYTSVRFRIKKIVFNESLGGNFLKKLVIKYANMQPHRYEAYLSTLLPLDDISFLLEKIQN